MGLDIYVGAFTRYYAGNWQTSTAKFAEEQGLSYQRVTSGGQGIKDPAVIRRIVVDQWIPHMQKGLADTISAPFVWDEREDAPYFTAKPDWSGFHGLVLAAAHTEFPDLAMPHDLPADLEEDEAYQRVGTDGHETRFASLYAPRIWLPMDFDVTFDGPTPASEDETVGSSYDLYRCLARLDSERFRSRPDDLAAWERGEGLASFSPCERAARIGFAMFVRLTGLAIEHRLPMVLDY